jgi:hypothetical protein
MSDGNLVPIYLAMTLLGSDPASAEIVSGEVTGVSAYESGGKFVCLTVPFSESEPDNTVGMDNHQDNNLYGFDEAQALLLSGDLPVDVLAEGLEGESNSHVLSAGITVASHYVFYDPAVIGDQAGEVKFDGRVLAIITSSRGLAGTDSLLGANVDYLNPHLRGLESEQEDMVEIIDPTTVRVRWIAGSPGDYIRVITEYTPEAGRACDHPK